MWLEIIDMIGYMMGYRHKRCDFGLLSLDLGGTFTTIPNFPLAFSRV
jgi:hypothetical protein